MRIREIPYFSDTERFTSKYAVNSDTGCWEWTRSLNDSGYGQFSISKKCYRAHRVSWKIFKGPLDPNKVLDHKCKNRRCVNPEHLREVTSNENTLKNSFSWWAVNSEKTHCPRGHEYTAENTNLRPQSCGKGLVGRQCKQCIREKSMEKYRAKKAVINARRKEIYHMNAKENRSKIYEQRRKASIRSLF